MIFIDTSIFMYAAGKEHPNKEPSATLLKLIAVGEVDAVINVEVLQEIYHRYTMIKMKEKGIDLAKKVITIVPRIYSIEQSDAGITIEFSYYGFGEDMDRASFSIRIFNLGIGIPTNQHEYGYIDIGINEVNMPMAVQWSWLLNWQYTGPVVSGGA